MPVANAGKPATPEMLTNIPQLISKYYTTIPDVSDAATRVVFGTSGHRGSSLKGNFTERHIAAIVQAICDLRNEFGASGPLFLGMDTHALSYPAHATAVSVLAANNVQTFIAEGGAFVPTPVISRTIIRYNKGRSSDLADGIVITPSHNPPSDGGIKYNCTHGGPSAEDMTKPIADRANKYLENDNKGVKMLPLADALKAPCVSEFDFMGRYIDDLDSIIDFAPIRKAGLRLGADALGGAGLAYWKHIAAKYGLDITVLHDNPDPTFSFMCIDHDGKIRMDCSSPYAMAGLISMKDSFDLGFANDPDFDRHGIVCPNYGLMNPNHNLAVAIDYLFRTRPQWSKEIGIGKTLVSSMMIDKVAASLGRRLVEVPVGFKWFVEGLDGSAIGFAGEESAGGSFLQKNGDVWTTDKDGIIFDLLAAEITAVTGKTPAQHYADLEAEYGKAFYSRRDTKATAEQKARVASLEPSSIGMTELAGDKILSIATKAPGNNAPIGGVKILCENCWAAIRPSGTEDICKVYAESFISQKHLEEVIDQASKLL